MILDDRESCFKLKKNCAINDHWKPFSLKCSFCEIDYRIIGKIEDFERDRKFIGRLIGVDFENLVDLGMANENRYDYAPPNTCIFKNNKKLTH